MPLNTINRGLARQAWVALSLIPCPVCRRMVGAFTRGSDEEAAEEHRRRWKVFVAIDIAIVLLAVMLSVVVGDRFACTGQAVEMGGDSSDPFCAFEYVPLASLLALGLIVVVLPAAAWSWWGKQGAVDALVAASIALGVVGLIWLARLI